MKSTIIRVVLVATIGLASAPAWARDSRRAETSSADGVRPAPYLVEGYGSAVPSRAGIADPYMTPRATSAAKPMNVEESAGDPSAAPANRAEPDAFTLSVWSGP